MPSYIIYDGPSLIDGKPIICIFQQESRNSKTGAMCQTYILRKDIDPITASRKGEDKSICGTCIHMGQAHDGDKGQAKNRTCYVTLAHGPLNKYKGFHKCLYTHVSGHERISALGSYAVIRVGTYGDPSAVPQYIWDSLLSRCDSWTAYTHGETNVDPKRFMTSADSWAGAKKAWDKGERTFRVIPHVNQLDKTREFLCPASEEMGKRTDCASCKLCAGSSVKAKSVAIVAHGTSKAKAKQMLETQV